MRILAVRDELASVNDNLIKYSEEFDNAAWATAGLTVTPDAAEAPDLSRRADKLLDADAVSGKYAVQNASIADDSEWYAVSVYLRKDEDTSRFPGVFLNLIDGVAQNLMLQVNTQTGASVVEFSAGSVASAVAAAGQYWRVTVAVQNNSSGNATGRCATHPARGTVWGVASGAATGSVYAWGFQIEKAAVASEYMPTENRDGTRTNVRLARGNLRGRFAGGMMEAGNVYGIHRSGRSWVRVDGDASGVAPASPVMLYRPPSGLVVPGRRLWTPRGAGRVSA